MGGFILPNQGPHLSSFFILEGTSLRRHSPLSKQYFFPGRVDYMGAYILFPCSPNSWVLSEKPKANGTVILSVYGYNDLLTQ